LIPTLSKLMGKAKKLCAPRPNPVTFVPDSRSFFRAEPLMLIVCPNRELAVQIFNEARRFCYRSMLRPCVVYGGGPRRDQLNQIAKGCDVLIGTPGRLVDFITNEHERISMCRLKYLIIDEADEMLSADWEDEFKVIMNGSGKSPSNL
jgi:ATP-dependent RNA helicase DDX3X